MDAPEMNLPLVTKFTKHRNGILEQKHNSSFVMVVAALCKHNAAI